MFGNMGVAQIGTPNVRFRCACMCKPHEYGALVVLDRVFSRSKWTVFLLYQEHISLSPPGVRAIWAWFALSACAKPLARILATPLGAYEKYYVLLLINVSSTQLEVEEWTHNYCQYYALSSVLTHVSGLS